MSKRKRKPNNQQSQINNTVEIDYDKLAETIVKGILTSKDEYEKNRTQNETKQKELWQNKIGLKTCSDKDKLLKKLGVNIHNFLYSLKAFVFYKKEHAQNPRFSFGMMQIICSGVFSIISLIFVLYAVFIIINICLGNWNFTYITHILLCLFFARFANIIKMEIDQMESNETINMFFSSLMAFIAALFTVISFIYTLNR